MARKIRLGFRGSLILWIAVITSIGFLGMVMGLSLLIRKELSSTSYSASEIAGKGYAAEVVGRLDDGLMAAEQLAIVAGALKDMGTSR